MLWRCFGAVALWYSGLQWQIGIGGETQSGVDAVSVIKKMPLRGLIGRKYRWCVLCKQTLDDEKVTLRMHVCDVHGMELLPGCSLCFHYRYRWSDVKKHCKTQHNYDLESSKIPPGEGCRWGLTEMDAGTVGKPTYAWVSEQDICPYPLENETMAHENWRVFLCAKFPARQSVREREEHAETSETAVKGKRGRPRKDGGETSGVSVKLQVSKGKKSAGKKGGVKAKTEKTETERVAVISPVKAPVADEDSRVVERKTAGTGVAGKGASKKRSAEPKMGDAEMSASASPERKVRRTVVSSRSPVIQKKTSARRGLTVSIVSPELEASKLLATTLDEVADMAGKASPTESGSFKEEEVDGQSECSGSPASTSGSSYTSVSSKSASSEDELGEERAPLQLAVLDAETAFLAADVTKETTPRRSPRGSRVEKKTGMGRATATPAPVPAPTAVIVEVIPVDRDRTQPRELTVRTMEAQTTLTIDRGEMIVIIPRAPGQAPVRIDF
jgi:hypothetical protein